MEPVIFYCYDAYCNWCYGFSGVMLQIATDFRDKVQFEVLSGGMILPESPKPISLMAGYFLNNCKTVTEHTGVTFGEDFLWHIKNPDRSDWFPDSEKPAIAMCVFKEYHPDKQVAFAADLQYALQYEGRDLCDDEAYRHLLEKYAIPADAFYKLVKDPAYKEKAQYEFDLCKQLQVKGYPAVLLQVNESKFVMLASGYTTYDVLKQRIESALQE
ncbi:DsbA family protein [Niastella caeni]|uniref:DsbA family protein n=1 Tax=Niastella caeni TaxID=2569763 RepID=A0A4S8I350_9BACT|nr:DsbA family protein [Niastella caeni]THU41979.1 DsbA family protein [Niastella caeni]